MSTLTTRQDLEHPSCANCDKREFNLIYCPICNASFCEECAAEHMHEICPNCGDQAMFLQHSGNFTETHGLDCGPYETWTETWLTCNRCGAKTDEKEVEQAIESLTDWSKRRALAFYEAQQRMEACRAIEVADTEQAREAKQ